MRTPSVHLFSFFTRNGRAPGDERPSLACRRARARAQRIELSWYRSRSRPAGQRRRLQPSRVSGRLFAIPPLHLGQRVFGLGHVTAGRGKDTDLLCQLDLENRESEVAERHFATREIKFPHPAEAFVADLLGPLAVGEEALAPVPEGF